MMNALLLSMISQKYNNSVVHYTAASFLLQKITPLYTRYTQGMYI